MLLKTISSEKKNKKTKNKKTKQNKTISSGLVQIREKIFKILGKLRKYWKIPRSKITILKCMKVKQVAFWPLISPLYSLISHFLAQHWKVFQRQIIRGEGEGDNDLLSYPDLF